jgi:hypothetical protein
VGRWRNNIENIFKRQVEFSHFGLFVVKLAECVPGHELECGGDVGDE